ncbi:PPK2 family polyphosphate kinase [Serinibacter arcticus]|uniref:UDP-galactose-lipid carrier transferase n=1 Tax=Serinibacter arcticus TaxID=1655435 RepID=A0A4Z1DZ66_9MICO|nr:PPK2 family polyphosphate kinase [Serinibacter arcticus]TGO04158.1 UDP-galactose-lipid carrier transferase [Serinibacter arcticus]
MSSKKKSKKSTRSAEPTAAFDAPLADLLRPEPGSSLADVDTRATPGWDAGRSAAEARTLELGETLSELQERLFAEGRSGGTRSVLLVLQGLDTSGKGGIVRHVLGMVDPQGVTIRSFGVPTEKERSHSFLWRIRRALPSAGRIGVFDRSHYEDVLVARVDALADPETIERRYRDIVRFEKKLAAAGTTIVKVALVISPAEQYERLSKRLARPDKHWKFAVSDLDTRAKWPRYTEAYDIAIERTSTETAPWHVVPADRKWFARLAVTQLLVDALTGLDLAWPEATFDVEAAIEALDATQDDPLALTPAEIEERAEQIERTES